MYIRLIIVLIFFNSCQLNIEKPSRIQSYKYVDDFNYYLHDNFDFDLFSMGKEKLFVIPISSCTPCVDEVLINLNNNTCSSCSLLFVGESQDKQRSKSINILSSKFTSYFDIKSDLYNYQSNIGKPSVLFIKEKKVRKMVLDYIHNAESKKILDWK